MWEFLDSRCTFDHLGFLPFIIRPLDPRPTAEQVEERYQHGGGWRESGKGKWRLNDDNSLSYPEEEDLQPLARLHMANCETVYFYPLSLVCVVQVDRSFAVCRMD